MSKTASTSTPGAIEYLILIAVVLGIAVVAIILLQFFPGLESEEQASKAYWAQTAPFAINDAKYIGNELRLTVRNAGLAELTLTGVTVGDKTGTLEPVTFASRDVKLVIVGGLPECTDTFNGQLALAYTEAGQSKIFVGKQNLVGRCGQ